MVIDAAIPECSAGTLLRDEEVTGTMAIPKPIPAMASVQPTDQMFELGEMTTSVRMIPTAATTHPMVIGVRFPTRATHRPVSREASTIPTVMGMKSRARA